MATWVRRLERKGAGTEMWNDPGQLASIYRAATLAAAVLAVLTGASSALAYTANRRIETLTEVMKRTAPQLEVFLDYADDGKLYAVIDAQNEVPFDFEVRLLSPANQIVNGLTLARPAVYPTKDRRRFIAEQSLDMKRLGGDEVQLKVSYSSLYAAEVGDSSLAGQILKRYRLKPMELAVEELALRQPAP